MSLKAKLEAVIYAAEEPVTLAQLAVLFAGEALEWKAARDAEQAPALPLPEEAAAEAAAESLASPMETAEATNEATVEQKAGPEAGDRSEPEVSSPAALSEETEVIQQTSELEGERPSASDLDIRNSETGDSPMAEPPLAEDDAEDSSPEMETLADTATLPEAAVGQSELEGEVVPLSEASVESSHVAPFVAPFSEEAHGETPAIVDQTNEDQEDQIEETAGLGSATAELQSELSEPVGEASDPNSVLAAAVSAEEAEFEARRQERRRDREARETLRSILDELIAEYAGDARGIEIREIAGGYRMGTKPEMHDAVRAFVKSLKPPLKLSLPALETLAVIAYKQPVTAPEVGEIRGVDSAGVLGSLMSRKLIATAGRKQVVGRPMLYKTTREFLLRFGLKDISELPSMEEFEKMAAQELSEDIADEGAAQTGDLFAESETATVPEGEEPSEESESSSAEPADEPVLANPEAQASETTENQTTGATPDEEEIEAKP